MIMIVFLGLLIFLFLVGMGVPFAIGGTSLVIMALESGIANLPAGTIAQRMVSGVNSFTLLAIPFFLLAGKLMNTGSITKRIFNFANYIVGWIPGGLGHANVVASIIFAGMSGSAVADAAGLGTIEMDAMENAGFDKEFSAAVTAASSTIGPIIPPSIPLIVFGVAGNVSITRLLLGGIIPGLLMGICLMLMIYFFSIKRKYPCAKFPGVKAFVKCGGDAFLPLLTPVILIGGILGGVFTATEAAAVASVYALLLSCFIYRELTIWDLIKICREVVRETAVIMFIVAASSIYGFLIVKTQIPMMLMNGMLEVTRNPMIILLLLNLFLLVVGCFMETNAAIIILTPLILPMATQLGIDPVHIGLVVVLNLMVGLLTPPVGMCLYAVCRVAKLPFDKMVKAILPFYIPLFFVLLLITFVPVIVLWLPNLVFN